VALYVYVIVSWPCIKALTVNIVVAAPNPFAGYPDSIRIRGYGAHINRFNGTLGYIGLSCT
jgi:hypothetical protein